MAIDEPIQYTEFGEGDRPVVLLHGLFGGPENWREIVENFDDEYRFFALQFPIDHGLDRRHTDFNAIDQLTDYVESFFDELHLDKAVLCGNSLGGLVAVDFCLRHSQRVEKLVLTGSAGLFEHALSGGKYPRAEPEFIRERVKEIFFDASMATDELVEEVVKVLADRKYVRFLIRIARATQERNVKDELSQIDLPTLIIWGKDDQITPPFVAQEFSDGIRNSQLVFIDKCGHAPPLERPREFSRILEEFLKTSLPACPSRN